MWEVQAVALFKQEENEVIDKNNIVKSHSEPMVESEKKLKTLIQSSVHLLM